MAAAHRREVVGLYRQILRLGRQWSALTGVTHQDDSHYIQNEARTLFRRNKQLTDEEEIRQCLVEARARMDMALHYKNPYPRPVNYPQTVLPPSGKRRTLTSKTMERAKPVYIRSYDLD